MKPKHFGVGSTDLLEPKNYKDVIEPLLNVRNGRFGRTLDVGSNTTWLAQFIEDYWGIEVNRGIVKASRAYWVGRQRWTEEEASTRIHLLEDRSSTRFPFADNSFDCIVLRDVLEHVDDPLKMYKEAARVLRQGGHVYVSCPDSQRHVWDEPTHKRPFPIAAQKFLGHREKLKLVYAGYESVLPGTQRLAKIFGGRTPWIVRVFWKLWFWPRNAVTIHAK